MARSQKSPLVQLSHASRDDDVSSAIRRALPEGTFNPSVRKIGRTTYVSAREPAVDGSVTATLYRFDDDTLVSRRNLSHDVRPFGIETAADPKIVVLDDEPWVTFNTGWRAHGNRLFLCRADDWSEPIECLFSARSMIEKNWAFFKLDGLIAAIYSVRPVRIIVCTDRNETSMTFEQVAGPIPGPIRRKPIGGSLTIGTQVVQHGERLQFIAHEKVAIGRSRLYAGRAASIGLGRTPVVEVSSRRLIHDVRALRARRPRRNPHLFGCTYFSGFDLDEHRALLSYGVNDASFALADVEWASLW